MIFKEGSKVEVLRMKKEAYGSWYPAEILSKTGNIYNVRYELHLSRKGEPVVEKVHEEDIRPCPPPANGRERWVAGDIAEIFDLGLWRVGKIAKILGDDYFVVRLFGSIQIKEFHVSNLRVRRAWSNNRWILLDKASKNKDACKNSRYTSNRDSAANEVKYGEARTKGKCDQNYVYCLHPGKNENKKQKFIGSSSAHAAAVQENHNQRRCNREVQENYLPMAQKLSRKVDALPSSNDLVGTSSLPIIEESIECSVASCSGNDHMPGYTFRDPRNESHSREIASSPYDDTCSFTPKEQKRYRDVSGHKLVADLHELELQAYKSTVQALHASGPLSWEQESLLTNLRLSLHISNEEHLLQLRNLLSE